MPRQVRAKGAVRSSLGTMVRNASLREQIGVSFLLVALSTEDLEVLWSAIYEVAKKSVAEFASLPHVGLSLRAQAY
jgi:hypothetical protein